MVKQAEFNLVENPGAAAADTGLARVVAGQALILTWHPECL